MRRWILYHWTTEEFPKGLLKRFISCSHHSPVQVPLREGMRKEALLHAVLWAPDMEILPSSMTLGVLLAPLHLAGREEETVEDQAWQCWPLPSPIFFGANFKGDWEI